MRVSWARTCKKNLRCSNFLLIMTSFSGRELVIKAKPAILSPYFWLFSNYLHWIICCKIIMYDFLRAFLSVMEKPGCLFPEFFPLMLLISVCLWEVLVQKSEIGREAVAIILQKYLWPDRWAEARSMSILSKGERQTLLLRLLISNFSEFTESYCLFPQDFLNHSTRLQSEIFHISFLNMTLANISTLVFLTFQNSGWVLEPVALK